MPLYLYKHPQKEEYVEIIQGMSDIHEYFDEDGLKWERRWTVPNASIDTKIDPWSNNDFVNKTGMKKGTYGDLMDQSAELSAKRADSTGKEDPLKRKYFDDYSKARHGQKHHLDKPRKYEDKNIKIEF